MKYILSIFIWLIGGFGYLFIFTSILILNLFFSKKFLYKYLSVTSRIILRIIFIRTKVIFEEPIDKNKTYIFMPNHVSMFDVLIASAYFPVNMNAIEAHTHFKWFLYGRVIKIFGQIPINRTNARESLKSFEIAKERLKTRSIIVFPEGTRSKDGKMRSFKKLPFKFAKDAGYDIVPVGFIGIDKIAPEESIWITPAKLKLIFGKQISPDQAKKLSADELKDNVRNEVERILKQYK
ncbi:MAG: 1-acyl-sn-glycerol-3-phosphate acyltransferase [Bacteroidales bacterium]|nr:1-acyl-sn-glycerol-3-phosphate acyltransferase [Bacteroidales bacterium]